MNGEDGMGSAGGGIHPGGCHSPVADAQMKLSLQRVVTIDGDYSTTLMADFTLLMIDRVCDPGF